MPVEHNSDVAWSVHLVAAGEMPILCRKPEGWPLLLALAAMPTETLAPASVLGLAGFFEFNAQ